MLILLNWPGLLKTDNINRMIRLSVITLSGFHCNLKILTFQAGIEISACEIFYLNVREKYFWFFFLTFKMAKIKINGYFFYVRDSSVNKRQWIFFSERPFCHRRIWSWACWTGWRRSTCSSWRSTPINPDLTGFNRILTEVK